jgi:riboflavin kinase/FMN adenylyltransferase
MKIIRGCWNRSHAHLPLTASIVTLGNFDGFHLGHQALLARVKTQAATLGLPTVLMLFEPQPKEFFARQQGDASVRARLTRFSEKYRLARAVGIDYLYVLRFDQALGSLSAPAFVRDILVEQLGAKVVVVGDDCRFGAGRLGDFSLLHRLSARYAYMPIQIPAIMVQGERVSSTRIRALLQGGEVASAAQLLGRPYAVFGKVVSGDQRGRLLGFPTANVPMHRERVVFTGVFAVRVTVGDAVYHGVANVGVRPTFQGAGVLLEVHVLDFKGDLYGQRVCVEFLQKLREEKRFAGVEALVAQIKRDVLAAIIPHGPTESEPLRQPAAPPVVHAQALTLSQRPYYSLLVLLNVAD